MSEILDLDPKFALVVIGEGLSTHLEPSDMERLYFLTNSTPIAVLVQSPSGLDDALADTIRTGTLDVLYEHEIASGLILNRIDRLLLTSRINATLVATQRDAGQRERLERELTLREQVLDHERELNANIIGSITSGLVIIDIDGSIILVNKHARQFLPEASGDILGSSYTESLPIELQRAVTATTRRSSRTTEHHILERFRIGDRSLEVSAYRMLDYHNNIIGILLLMNDITEQENMNTLLYRSEKLAAIGTMLSGVAHELRNPLSIISARVQRAAMRGHTDAPRMQRTLSSIGSQAERCASIVNSLLNFTRNTATSVGFCKIADIIDEALTYIQYQNMFDNVIIQRHYSPGLTVYGDRTRFVQVFLNLITNAVDAMEDCGPLGITTSRAGNRYTLVEVHDAGYGIESDVVDKIFDPFFTTKEPGKGTGLGLSIVYKIVEESGGRIRVKSRPGSTSFFVTLPSMKERERDVADTAG